MKMLVCIKQVPDVTAPAHIRDGKLAFDSSRMVLNAYDASAVEAALVLAEQNSGEVEVISVGDEQAKEIIRKALAMGADRAVHLQIPAGTDLDSAGYARLLADYIRTTAFDLILCGKQSQDTDAGLTGSMLAELLQIPFATNAVALDIEANNGTVAVTRQGDAGQEILELNHPALVTCSNDMNEPRIPNIKGIMQAKKKPVETLMLSDMPGASTWVIGYESMPERAPGKILEGDPVDITQTLADLLAREAKVL